MTVPAEPSNQAGQWAHFSDARAAMETMSVEELRDTSGLEPPRLLPFSTPAVIVGVVLALISLSNLLWLPLALLVMVYGLIALGMNRTRITQYREECYRRWVHRRADEMREAGEIENG